MMTAIMKKHLKKNKKGFTLIEVVVVLVILAILAAIAVPALTGYITDAKERTATSEARTVLVGLQHLASTNATDNNGAVITAGYFDGNKLSAKGVTQIKKLTGLTNLSTTNPNTITFGSGDASDSVTGFVYLSTTNISITYSGGTFAKTVTP